MFTSSVLEKIRCNCERNSRMTNLKNSLIAIFLGITLCLLLIGCTDSTSENTFDNVKKEVKSGVIIDYDSNLLMNIYNIRVSTNDMPLGVQQQGNTILYELSLPEGENTLSLVEFGDDKNTRSETFVVSEGEYYYFFIKTRNSGIEIEKRDVMSREDALLLKGLLIIKIGEESDEEEKVFREPIRIEPATPVIMEPLDEDPTEDEPDDDFINSADNDEPGDDSDLISNTVADSVNNIEPWKDAYLGRVGDGAVFGLFDMGAEYPVLVVRSSTVLRGNRHTTYGYYNGRVIKLSEDGTPLISYEEGFISIMSQQGINDYFWGFNIDDLLKHLYANRGEGNIASAAEAGIIAYDMSFGKDNVDNYFASNRLDRKMDNPTALFLDLKKKAERMPGQVETWKMDNTDRDVIINWEN